MNKLQFLTLYMETFCFNTSFVWALYVFIPTKSKEFVNYSGLRIIFMQKKRSAMTWLIVFTSMLMLDNEYLTTH